MKRKKCSLNLPHILDLSYQPYTGKKIADIENQSFASRNRTSAGRSLKSFHDISSKNAISSNRNSKRSYKHCQESFFDIYATLLFHTPELVSLSQIKVK